MWSIKPYTNQKFCSSNILHSHLSKKKKNTTFSFSLLFSWSSKNFNELSCVVMYNLSDLLGIDVLITHAFDKLDFILLNAFFTSRTNPSTHSFITLGDFGLPTFFDMFSRIFLEVQALSSEVLFHKLPELSRDFQEVSSLVYKGALPLNQNTWFIRATLITQKLLFFILSLSYSHQVSRE